MTRESSGHSSTNGTWARTGRISQGGAPIYQRPGVLLGAVLGIAGVGVGGWFLMRSAPVGNGLSSTAPAAAVAAQPAPASIPAASRPEATSGEKDKAAIAQPAAPAPTVGVVRPIEAAPRPEREQETEPALNDSLDDDLFVREAKGRVDDDAAKGKKKGPAVTARPERPRPAPSRPRPSASSRAPAEGASPAPAQSTAPKKNSNTLDLFDDTK
jgi:hypothetical protein